MCKIDLMRVYFRIDQRYLDNDMIGYSIHTSNIWMVMVFMLRDYMNIEWFFLTPVAPPSVPNVTITVLRRKQFESVYCEKWPKIHNGNTHFGNHPPLLFEKKILLRT